MTDRCQKSGRYISDCPLAEVCEALSKKEQMYSRLIENTPDLVWLTDEDGKLLMSNTAFREAFSTAYSITLENGMSMIDMTDGEEREFWEDVTVRARTGETFQIMRAYRFDGYDSYVDISVAPVFDRHGEYAGVSFFSRDITERVILEQELLNERAALSQTVQLATQMIEVENGFGEYLDGRA